MDKKFTIKLNTLSVFIAKRNSGKSYLMKHLLSTIIKKKSTINWVKVITPTKFNGEWSNILGDDNVYDEFDNDLIDDILDRQKILKNRNIQNAGLLILDDCLGSANFHNSLFTKLASAGRHYNLTVWISFQHYYKVPTVLRTNSDYLFVLGNHPARVSKSLFEDFSTEGVNNVNDMEILLQNATDDHGVLIVDNSSSKTKMFSFKAPSKLKNLKIEQ